ncbi:hypothetical protein [Microcystis aeruginosa]|nr:hypothetical protein [Microcystis aeruginosa]
MTHNFGNQGNRVWGSGEVGKWGSGEVGKWGSGEVGCIFSEQ